MTNKGITTSIIVVVVLIVAALGYWYFQNPSAQQPGNGVQSGAQGMMILGITDAAANMNAITSIVVTVKKVEVHSAGQGWVTVSTAPRQYDLLALKSSESVALLAQANVPVDTYDRVRLTVERVVLVENGIQKEVKIPSSELKINLISKVQGSGASTVVLDFLADRSLHVTGRGNYIMTPVVKVETRQNAEATVNADNTLSINGGTLQTNETVGMDVSGEFKKDFAVSANAVLEISGNIIQVTTPLSGAASSVKVNASDAAQAAVSGGHLDMAIAARLTTQNNVRVWEVSGVKGLENATVLINATTGAVITGNAQGQTAPRGSGNPGGSIDVGGSGNVQIQY